MCKILFFVLVYGVFVMVCLGGVVWGFVFFVLSVLLIYYLFNEFMLEFFVDLFFYNFFMLLVVCYFKFSDGLYVMYMWWFWKCV